MTLPHVLGTAALLLVLAAPARAATDYTDTWWNPAESGWGVNLTQQNSLIYATFYVYGVDGKATWFSALLSRIGASERFGGPLFRTTGTWYGAPWNGNQIVQVGAATFDASSSTRGTLSYTADNVTVNKPIERLFMQALNVEGLYIGGASGRRNGCGTTPPIVDPMEFDVTHSATTGLVTIDHYSTRTGDLICRMRGTAVQSGKVLTMNNATYDCTGDWRSTARIYNLRPTPAGFEAQYVADAGGGCTESGQISGVTRTP
jgi:hypothetical protein